MKSIIAYKNKKNTIGRQGEENALMVKFPLNEFDSYEIARVELTHERKGDKGGIPCVVTHDSDYVYWIPNLLDLEKEGEGVAQVTVFFNNGRTKSELYPTLTLKSIGIMPNPPAPFEPYLDQFYRETAEIRKMANIIPVAHSLPAGSKPTVSKNITEAGLVFDFGLPPGQKIIPRCVSIPHSAEPHCDSEETEDGLILTFYIPMGEKGDKGDKGDDYILTEEDKEEIASKVHYDDSELREMIDSKASIIMLHSELSNGVWSIKNADGNTLTYADIKALHNKEDYIVCLHQNVIHSTSFLTDAVEFMGTYYINDNGYISRLIINDANVVKADGYALENSENKLEDMSGYEVGDIPNSYPSTDALVEYIKDGNNLPVATNTTKGVVKLNADKGAYIDAASDLILTNVSENIINNRLVHQYRQYRALTVDKIDYAVKSALTDGKGSPYTEAEKKSARQRIGAEGEWKLLQDVTLTEDVVYYEYNDGKKYRKMDILISNNGTQNEATYINCNVNYGNLTPSYVSENTNPLLAKGFPHSSGQSYSLYRLEVIDGIIECERFDVSGYSRLFHIATTFPYASNVRIATSAIEKMAITTYTNNVPLKSGLNIKIYGVEV